MKGIVHIRIDDRLLHGQVALLWSKRLRVDRIIIINDKVANNELQKSILRMAAQGDIRTSIITKETACRNILNGKYASQRCMIILKNPDDALELIRMGLDMKEINVGNMMSTAGDAIQVKKSLRLTPDEIGKFRELERLGVVMTSVMVPDEPNSYLKDYLDKVQAG